MSGRVRSAHPVAVWSAVVSSIVLALGRVVLEVADPGVAGAGEPFGGGPALAVVDALIIGFFAAVGLVVARKQPTNPVGWVLCLIPVALGLLLVSNHAYDSLAARDPDGAAAQHVAWFASWVWIPFTLPALTVLPLYFPTGRLLTARWRAVPVLVAIAVPLLFLGTAFESGRMEDYDLENPYGATGALETPVLVAGIVGFALMVVATLAAATSLVLRFRRSRGEERQQLKWVSTAAVLFVLSFAAPTDEVAGDAGFGVLLLGLVLVETSVAIAMLRYRLYDIDLVINRALVYGSLTAILAVTYVGTVLLLQLALSGITEGSGLAVAASTLAVAALFRPALGRIQRVVDRRFFRSRYDAARTLEQFGSRLRHEVDLEALSGDLQAVVVETLRPATVSLWLRGHEVSR